MAIIQYTGIVNQIRGKLNGSVFNKTKNGYTLQRRQAPRKGSTPVQSLRRRQFGAVQRAYKLLSQEEKNNASIAAANNPVFDRFGNLVVLSGYNHWVKSNLVRLHADLPILEEIDSTPAPPFAIEASAIGVNLTFYEDGRLYIVTAIQSTVTVANTSDLLIVSEIAQPQSKGVSSPPHGFLRVAGFVDPNIYEPGDSLDKSYASLRPFKYPVPGPEELVPVRWQFWRPSSGSLIHEFVALASPIVSFN